MSGFIEPRGIVQRLVFLKDGLPFVEWRTRDLECLLSEAEWGWSKSENDAYVFAKHDGLFKGPDAFAEIAAVHCAKLKELGEPFGEDVDSVRYIAIVFGLDHQLRREREKRHEDRIDNIEVSARETATGGRPTSGADAMGRWQEEHDL